MPDASSSEVVSGVILSDPSAGSHWATGFPPVNNCIRQRPLRRLEARGLAGRPIPSPPESSL